MKILFVTTSTGGGGAEKVLAELAADLKSKGLDIAVLSLYPLGVYAEKMKSEGVPVSSLNMKYIPSPFDLHKLKKKIAELNPDIVHAFLFRAIEMCRIIKPDHGFKLITTPHTNYARKNIFFRALDRAYKDRDDLSTAESLSTYNYLLNKQKYNKDKTVLISNEASASFFKDEELRNKTRAELGLKSKNTFISVARLEKEKGHTYLLEAYAKVYGKNKNNMLLLAGEGRERAALEALAKELKISEGVKFLGRRNDINALLNASDIFVLSSVSESLPLAVLEAFAVGLPAVITDCGDNKEIYKHGEHGFISPAKDAVLTACFLKEISQTATKEKFQSNIEKTKKKK
ncbi:glycosyltransferase [Parelusimicrobium proximum]|uniref:glycosyltransferase n=1 Tax=Parelusimicrobium proximum TaxID=3228953 RepID=UPI003D17992A